MEPNTQSTSKTTRNILKSVLLPGLRNFLIGVIALGAALCLLAGRLGYWQGWVFSVLFSGLTNGQGIYLGIKDPQLLERRTHIAASGESRGQKIFILVALAANACLMIFSALDQRFRWSQVPALVSVFGNGLLVLSFIVYYFVFRENSYAASSIQTFAGQKVISTGPYALVRHPKYVGDLFLVIGTPLALGSWWALVFVLLTIPALMWRILDEEKLLKKDLPGYIEYTQKVNYRLLPAIW
ncbi:MAG TPA: isoprenylcysteine carboxylmethyltransferase family protein [Anaerolineales bacterium]|nr:isoprenylcysteine carboxylmethyltransferase family protein [Anaerolineales bacterium]